MPEPARNLQVRIRAYRGGDEKGLVHLWNRSLSQDPISLDLFTRRVLCDASFDPEGLMVAERVAGAASGKAVGLSPGSPGLVGFLLALVRRVPLWGDDLEPEHAWITAFGVDSDGQGRGIGNALWAAATRFARARGALASRAPLLVAVDGGGSRTRLWVLDAGGHLLSRGEAGSSNLTAAGVEAAARAVAEAAQQAGLWSGRFGEGTSQDGGPAAGGPGGHREPSYRAVAVAALALAGADREPEVQQMRARMEELFPGARVVLVHDGVGALLAGTLGAPGLLLLAGTGALALALGPDGQEVRAGGWGYLLGDEGSGYWIGREAIRVALRAHDGRDPETALTHLVREAAGVGAPPELVGPVHRGDRDRAWVASLARGVLQAADAGDRAARRIMDQAADELALLVRAVLERAPFLQGVDPVPVVTAGGLFRLGPTWSARVEAALNREAPRARLVAQVREPVVGSAYLALQNFHGRLPADVLDRLRQLQQGSRFGPGGRGPGGMERFQPV